MAWIDGSAPQLFFERWRYGGSVARAGRAPVHAGAAKPETVVEIRKGHYHYDYQSFTAPLEGLDIPGESDAKPWRAQWVADSPWKQIPAVQQVELTQDFAQNGITVATLQVENIRMAEAQSPLGSLYHLVDRGYLAPFRNYTPPTRPQKLADSDLEWQDLLAGMAQIRVWQGYGPPERNPNGSMPADGGENGVWVFMGMIDDIDPTSRPDRITISARDHGKVLTDKRVFGWNISPQINDPVVFMDRGEADKITNVGGSASSSSYADGSPARFVTDDDDSTAWFSRPRGTPDLTEWVEIRLPAGRYEEYLLDPFYEGMECWVGIYLTPRPSHTATDSSGNTTEGASDQPPLVDGEEVHAGWLDLGKGVVPGDDNGGWPFIRHLDYISKDSHVRTLGHTIECGDNTRLRVAFRSLKLTAVLTGQSDEGSSYRAGYRAGVTRLQGRRRVLGLTKDERKSIILIDDAADIVRCVLRWAGFDEWRVENTGTSITGRSVWNRSSYLIDLIKAACDMTGYVFYMGDPSYSDSLGVPVFRRNRALEAPNARVEELRDTDMLTGIQCKVTEQPLGYIIRVRGKELSRAEGGHGLFGDRTNRVMAVYRPPWTRRGALAGVIKHVTYTKLELKTFEDCLVGCYLIALQEALEMATATVSIPAHPGFNLDDQVGLLDTGTGLNTRLWISQRSSTFTTGQQAAWTMTLAGSLIDTPDMIDLVGEINSKVPVPPGIQILSNTPWDKARSAA